MPKQKTTKKEVAKERSPKKREGVLKQKGYKSGKLPKDKELHHIPPQSEGGKFDFIEVWPEEHAQIYRSEVKFKKYSFQKNSQYV